MNMYWTVHYCLAIHLIAVSGFNEFDCTDSKIIVAETFCGHDNTTRFSMQTFSEDILNSRNLTVATLSNDGCPFEFEKPISFHNSLYIQCETEIICLDDIEDTPIKTTNTFFIECEDINPFNYPSYDGSATKTINGNSTYNVTAFNDDNLKHNAAGMKRIDDNKEATDSKKLIIAAGGVAAGLVTVAGLVAALYKLQTILQSGSYLFPNTPTTTGFSELA